MGKSTIIEAQNSDTVFENGTSKGTLGKITGPFADFINGTRNADRHYNEELWDRCIFNSESVMEALDTKTLFGELDHPEGDRCETLAKNAAISITKLEKRPEEGIIYGEAEILDTPTGRVLKALADSGAKLGISSRGLGDEVFVDGQNVIDPDTYEFITFDVVVTPANAKARVSLTESKHSEKLTESLQKELKDCETENQVRQIKKVVETINVSNKNTILTEIDEMLNKFNTKQESKLTEANKQLALKLLKEKYMSINEELRTSLEENKQLNEQNNKLASDNKFLTDSRNTLKAKIKENNQIKIDVNAKLGEANNQIKELEKKLEESEKSHNEILLKRKQIQDLKIENLEKQYKSEIEKLTESNNQKQEKINKMLEENKNLVKSIDSNSKIILENKKQINELKVKLSESNSKILETSKKLTESKTAESDKVKNLQSKLLELENNNRSLNESLQKFQDLAFTPIGNVKALKENFSDSDNYTDEDLALINTIVGNIK